MNDSFVNKRLPAPLALLKTFHVHYDRGLGERAFESTNNYA